MHSLHNTARFTCSCFFFFACQVNRINTGVWTDRWIFVVLFFFSISCSPSKKRKKEKEKENQENDNGILHILLLTKHLAVTQETSNTVRIRIICSGPDSIKVQKRKKATVRTSVALYGLGGYEQSIIKILVFSLRKGPASFFSWMHSYDTTYIRIITDQ